MSIELTQRVKRLEAALAEVNQQIAAMRLLAEVVQAVEAKDHVVNCTKVMDLVQTVEKDDLHWKQCETFENQSLTGTAKVEKRKPGCPPKHGGQVDSSGDRGV